MTARQSADALGVWRDSFTRRWHTNPDMSHTTDFNCAHQGRVALLALCLFPDAGLDLLRAAITHDQGEAGVGDVAFPVKQKHPEFSKHLDEMEAAHAEGRGLAPISLSELDTKKLKMCDRMDAVLWVLKCNPALSKTPQWQSDIAFCREQAGALGVLCPF